jgi:hypothetical protein
MPALVAGIHAMTPIDRTRIRKYPDFNNLGRSSAVLLLEGVDDRDKPGHDARGRNHAFAAT